MVRDVTLGQYFPGNSLLHRLDPRTKILLVTLYIIALFCAKSIVTYALLALVLAVCVRISKVGIRSLVRGLKPVLFIIIFTGILNLFFTPGDRWWSGGLCAFRMPAYATPSSWCCGSCSSSWGPSS